MTAFTLKYHARLPKADCFGWGSFLRLGLKNTITSQKKDLDQNKKRL